MRQSIKSKRDFRANLAVWFGPHQRKSATCGLLVLQLRFTPKRPNCHKVGIAQRSDKYPERSYNEGVLRALCGVTASFRDCRPVPPEFAPITRPVGSLIALRFRFLQIASLLPFLRPHASLSQCLG